MRRSLPSPKPSLTRSEQAIRPPDVVVGLPPTTLADDALLPLGLIDSAPNNPRQSLPDVDELAESIRRFGLLQPIVVRKREGRYELIGGHRRLAAFEVLHERAPHDQRWLAIPAAVRATDDATSYAASIALHAHTVTWSPLEEAAALEQLVLAGWRLAQIATALAKSEGWVSKRLRAYSDPVLSGYVQTGTLGATVAEELLTVRAPAQRRDLADRAAAESWTASAARQRVRGLTVGPMSRDIGRRARALSRDLRGVEPSAVTADVLSDLARLAETIEQRFPRREEKSAA